MLLLALTWIHDCYLSFHTSCPSSALVPSQATFYWQSLAVFKTRWTASFRTSLVFSLPMSRLLFGEQELHSVFSLQLYRYLQPLWSLATLPSSLDPRWLWVIKGKMYIWKLAPSPRVLDAWGALGGRMDETLDYNTLPVAMLELCRLWIDSSWEKEDQKSQRGLGVLIFRCLQSGDYRATLLKHGHLRWIIYFGRYSCNALISNPLSRIG